MGVDMSLIRKLAAIIVLVLVVSAIAGCAPNNTNQTPSASVAPNSTTYDPLLEKYLAAYKNDTYANATWSVKAWDLAWSSGTTARLQMAVLVKNGNITSTKDETFMVFPTTQEATQYLNAMNKTGYSLVSTDASGAKVFRTATGRLPTTYKDYQYFEGNPLTSRPSGSTRSSSRTISSR